MRRRRKNTGRRGKKRKTEVVTVVLGEYEELLGICEQGEDTTPYTHIHTSKSGHFGVYYFALAGE